MGEGGSNCLITSPMSTLKPQHVLYEDNHLLVVNKPAGVVTQGAASDQTSLVELAKQYLKQKYNKPGNVYLGVVSRLDKLTTGIIVLARTSKAAARLTQAFKERNVTKSYQALIDKTELPNSLTLKDHIRKNDAARRMEICSPQATNAQQAILHLHQLNQFTQATHLEIALETGRKHQIRVQLANYGCPIIGDRKYGSNTLFKNGIALHSARLELVHPTQKEPMAFDAPLPAEWNRWLS